MTTWNPTLPSSWAGALGMVAVPLFGREREAAGQNILPGRHSLLLDGERASFALSFGDSDLLLNSADPLSWSWSSNLTFSLVLDQAKDRLFVRRWDRPNDVREWPIPDVSRADRIIDQLVQDPLPSAETVIRKLLGVFWALRRNIESLHGNETDLICAFNILLVWADARRRSLLEPSFTNLTLTLADIVTALNLSSLTDYRIETFSCDSVREFRMGDLLELVLARDPSTGIILDPDLFIRHASGVLYEAAHVELADRPLHHSVQLTLFDEVSFETDRPSGTPARDAHFTPPSLARALVQEAVRQLTATRQMPDRLTILDPASGSGVFLIEASRELSSSPNVDLTLVGVDRSRVSCIMTDFCVKRSVKDDGQRALQVHQSDSLRLKSWGRPDLILMNPPFVSWEDLSVRDKESVKNAIGSLPSRLPDSSYAFIAKAIASLTPGSILASVVPGSFLDSSAAESLRELIQNDNSLTVRLIGKFRGYGYFQGAMVEPAFIVIEKASLRLTRRNKRTRLVIASSGFEDTAIRGLRRTNTHTSLHRDGWEIYDTSPKELSPASWVPAERVTTALQTKLREFGVPIVGDLFEVRQGLQTGNNPVFTLRSEEVSTFSSDPGFSLFFRPIADRIRDGVVCEGDYVFYPYGADGSPLVNSVEELEQALPRFYQLRLAPNQEGLANRRSLRGRPWWVLNWPRIGWLANPNPRIISAQFGLRGSFAFDDMGNYIVHAGNAWYWREGAFQDDSFPWAYLALLNSRIFEALVKRVCPQVQGGQFNLNKKYVDNVRIPNLVTSSSVNTELLGQLAEIGRNLNASRPVDLDLLDRTVASAYGLPLARMRAALWPDHAEIVQNRFDALAETWKTQTAHLSNLSRIVSHPSYQEIVSMGEDAIVPMLSDLQLCTVDWFPALAMITSENPVSDRIAGRVQEMATAWIRWGEQKGYL